MILNRTYSSSLNFTSNSIVKVNTKKAKSSPVTVQNTMDYNPLYYRPLVKPQAKQKTSLAFKGTPLRVPHLAINNFKDAIKTHEYLKSASYSDVYDDLINPENKLIRKNNYSFLDKLHINEDKSGFISYYKNLTGFPDLTKVSTKIEDTFVDSIQKASNKFLGSEYDCIAAGYDPTCSVGLKVAFPGSDIDKSYIILKGSSSDSRNKKIVNNFAKELWLNTDQRILSFNHEIAFPTIITEKQLKDQIQSIDNKTSLLRFNKKRLKSLINSGHSDLEGGAEYNIRVADTLSAVKDFEDVPFPNKQTAQNLAFIVEPIRDGKPLVVTRDFKRLKRWLKRYDFYNFSNIVKIKSITNAREAGLENKSKYTKRQALLNEFEDYPVDKQFDLVKSIIKYSSEDHNGHDAFFKGDRNLIDEYKPLLRRLIKGDKNIYHVPEFRKRINDDGLVMKYAEDKEVKLYQGENPETLWVDSRNTDDIEAVLAEFEHIKRYPMFKDVKKIQCPQPEGYVRGFNHNKKYTGNHDLLIYERCINEHF